MVSVYEIRLDKIAWGYDRVHLTLDDRSLIIDLYRALGREDCVIFIYDGIWKALIDFERPIVLLHGYHLFMECNRDNYQRLGIKAALEYFS